MKDFCTCKMQNKRGTDFSAPPYLLIFHDVTVFRNPRHLLVAHIPINPHSVIRAIQTVGKDRVAGLISKESLVVTGKLITSLNLRVRLVPALLREHHNTLQLLLVALVGVTMLLIKLPHSLAEFAPSNLLHDVYSFSI